MNAIDNTSREEENGAAMAAFLAAGIGSLAVGLFVILSATGIFSAPALYGPSGGVSGRTTFAVVIWLLSWVVLHRRWKSRYVEPRRIRNASLGMVALSIVLTFPLVWDLF